VNPGRPPLDPLLATGSLHLVIRRLSFLAFLCVAGTTTIHAELTEAQKKELIRRQHAGSTSSSSSKKKGAAGKSAAGSSKKTKKKSSTGSHAGESQGTHGIQKKKVKKQASSSSTRQGDKPSASHATGTAGPTPQTPVAAAAPAPPAMTGAQSAPLPLPLPRGAEPSAPITIEKSGVEPEQGLEPAPAAVHEGFWSRIFGSPKSYRYLTGSVRSAIDRAPVKRGRWKYIVVHNSGTREGNARVFDIYHRRVRHMVNGLAYHFVIGDGHGSGDGQVEIGDRWKRQINGGHVASDYLNDIALGICLVGDFNRDQPTPSQVGALEELVSYLRDRVGKSQGRRAIVHAHKEINPRPTDCPGGRFPYGWLHAKFGNER
jgi:N-acetylmuramoyl-L-alanine amidase